jgi:transposase
VDAERAEPAFVTEALDRIGKLYEHEAHIRQHGLEAETKVAYRGEYSKLVVERFFTWLKETLRTQPLLPSNPFAQRAIALGRRNWLFCWTEVGAQYVGLVQSLLASCRLQGVDPSIYLVDVLQRIDTPPAFDVHLLTPRLWKQHFAEDPLRSGLDRLRQ